MEDQFGGSISGLIPAIDYNAALLPASIFFDSGLVVDISSDVRNRPNVISSAGKINLDYRYNSRGLIDQINTSQNGSPGANRNITYDNLGRINTFVSDTGTLDYNFDKFGNLTSKTKVATGCRESDQRFTGKPTDAESGLQYYGARFMANSLGRFTSVDPSADSYLARNPQSWNRFSYALGNPIVLEDPDGEATH